MTFIKVYKYLLLFMIIFVVIGCKSINRNVLVSSDLNLDKYINIDTDTKYVPEVCKPYINEKKSIAVVISKDNKYYNQNLQKNLKDYLSVIGGLKVYDESYIYSRFKNLKNIQTLDKKRLIQIGKKLKIHYIVIGNLNDGYYYRTNLKGYMSRSVEEENFDKQNRVFMLNNVLYSFVSKIKITVIDVRENTIYNSKVLKSEYIASIHNPIFDSSYFDFNSAKRGLSKSIEGTIRDNAYRLTKFFPIYGYVMQSKTDSKGKQVVKVNLGSNFKIENGSIMRVYSFKEIHKDGKKTCKIIKTENRAVVTNNIDKDNSWMKVVIDSFSKIKKIPINSIIGRNLYYEKK